MPGPRLDANTRVLCFAPHPDDETIGAGALLAGAQDAWVIHVTDGAPADMIDARAHGFGAREEYARARRYEAVRALGLAGVAEARIRPFGMIDQQCAHELPGLIARILSAIQEVQPSVILTPAYEGGHPDHDSTAFAIHTSCGFLGPASPRLMEYALYHGPEGVILAGDFLPPRDEVVEIVLSPDQQALKQAMFACFRTQREVIAQFPTAFERFRPAPAYDFTQSPHPGKLFYENFSWGVTGERWRALAAKASQALGAAAF